MRLKTTKSSYGKYFRISAAVLIIGCAQKVAAQTVTNGKALSNPVITSNNFYSPSLGKWTNAQSLFTFATNNPFNGKYGLVIELADGGYIPAELWLGDQYQFYKDPAQTIGMLLEAGTIETSPGTIKPYTKIMHYPGQHVDVYNGSDPFHDTAANWYLKAAMEGNAEAEFKIGSYYCEYGRDYAAALQWFNQAYSQGNKRALNEVAKMYVHGFGVSKDLTTAIELYARNEEFDGISELCLQNGLRTPAYMWWCVGKAKNNSASYLSSINANLQFTPAERQAGAKAARTYLIQRYGTNFLGTNYLGANFFSK